MGLMLPHLLLLLAQGFTPLEGPVTDRFTMRSVEIRPGEGEAAKPGQEYTVHYTGWLTDGKKFDSSVDRQEPFVFIQGRRQVIAGWEAGFEGMRVGGKRRLFLPYPLAYGENGRGAIPPRAELIFDVELLAVRDVPAEEPARDLLLILKSYEVKILAWARAIPEDKYTWRPSPSVRSTGEVLAHMALGTRLMMDLAVTPAGEGFEQRVEAQWKQEREPRTKQALLAMVQESFAAARKQITPLRSAQLSREMRFFKDTTTVRGVYIALETHVAEHLGQLIAYARMQGVDPPSLP